MLKIDIHSHILPQEIPAFNKMFGYNGFIQLEKVPGCKHCNMVSDTGKFFRKVEENCFHPQVRIDEYQKYHTQVQVISTVPVMFSYWTKPKDGLVVSQFLNDHVAKVCKDHPRHYVGLGTLPLQDVDLSIQEARRCMQDLGFKGFQIGTHVNNVNLSDARFFPLYQELEKLDASLFIHPWEMMGEEHMSKYWLPWLVGMPAESARAICSLMFGGVFAQFPKLRFAFAHGGGSFPYTLGRIKHGFDVRPDLVAVDNNIDPQKYLGHFWLDSLVHDPDTFHYMWKKVGSDKICLGTDYPFPLGELEPGKLIESLDLSQTEKEKFFSGNALKWLNMTSNQFS